MFLFLFPNCWLTLLITSVIAKIFIVAAELAIRTRIPTKKAKEDIETHSVAVEAERSKCSV